MGHPLLESGVSLHQAHIGLAGGKGAAAAQHSTDNARQLTFCCVQENSPGAGTSTQVGAVAFLGAELGSGRDEAALRSAAGPGVADTSAPTSRSLPLPGVSLVATMGSKPSSGPEAACTCRVARSPHGLGSLGGLLPWQASRVCSRHGCMWGTARHGCQAGRQLPMGWSITHQARCWVGDGELHACVAGVGKQARRHMG